jgi:hypothetical protein
MTKGGVDARIRLANGGVRKSDDGEAWLLGFASIDFDDDSYCINPEGRGAPNFGNHGACDHAEVPHRGYLGARAMASGVIKVVPED